MPPTTELTSNSPWSGIWTRVLTAVLLAAVSSTAMASSLAWPCLVLVIACLLLCLFELADLLPEVSRLVIVAAVSVMAALIYSIPPDLVPWVAMFQAAAGGVLLATRKQSTWTILTALGAACWLVGGLGAALFSQRYSARGAGDFAWNASFLVVPCVWSGDTFAYFIGKKFGKTKLAPTISPKKTWEGAFAHVVGSIFFCFVCGLPFGAPVAACFGCGLIGSIFGQAGDLLQSSLKRSANIKDSGVLLPGHGGVLDRVDAMLLAAPFQLFFLWMIASHLFHVKQ